jgi:hypothetical protein
MLPIGSRSREVNEKES